MTGVGAVLNSVCAVRCVVRVPVYGSCRVASVGGWVCGWAAVQVCSVCCSVAAAIAEQGFESDRRWQAHCRLVCSAAGVAL